MILAPMFLIAPMGAQCCLIYDVNSCSSLWPLQDRVLLRGPPNARASAAEDMNDFCVAPDGRTVAVPTITVEPAAETTSLKKYAQQLLFGNPQGKYTIQKQP